MSGASLAPHMYALLVDLRFKPKTELIFGAHVPLSCLSISATVKFIIDFLTVFA